MAKRTTTNKNCFNCGKLFTRPKWIMDKQDFCKQQCGIDYWFRTHRGKNHPHWKEKGLTYFSFHTWIIKEYGNAPFCIVDDKTCSKRYEWADTKHRKITDKFNKSEICDFVPLCESHHVRFDRYKNI